VKPLGVMDLSSQVVIGPHTSPTLFQLLDRSLGREHTDLLISVCWKGMKWRCHFVVFIRKGKGWGVIAKTLGIKPGLKEFQELKNRDFGRDGSESNKGKGKEKGEKWWEKKSSMISSFAG